MFQREKFVEHNANAVAAGRVSGVDPIEQITKRCIRIVNPEAEVSACVLCRCWLFRKTYLSLWLLSSSLLCFIVIVILLFFAAIKFLSSFIPIPSGFSWI